MVIIDGLVQEEVLGEVERIIHPLPIPDIHCEAKADATYPIVNTADRIAVLLHRYYSKHNTGREKRKYLDHLLTPKIEEYRHIFRGQ
ncbi:MAG: hypothetical protein ABIG89_00705 [Candidatus Woesearchaeota archaeon]